MEDAGDTQVDIGVTGPVSLGIQANIAAAATDNIAFQLSARAFLKKNYIFDTSLGISENIGKKGRVGVFAGISRGQGENIYSILYDDYEITGSSKLMYIKPQFTLHSQNIDFVLSLKSGRIKQNFYYYEYQTGADGDWFEYEIEENREVDAIFIEPAFSSIVKFNKVRLVGTIAFIRNFGSNHKQGGMAVINCGVSVQFLKNKRKEI